MIDVGVFLADGRFAKFTVPGIAALYPPNVIQAYIDEAERNYCSEKKWGKFQLDGCFYYAAHKITMDMSDTAIAASEGEAIASGGAAAARQPLTSPAEEFDLTTWGREFKRLRTRVASFSAMTGTASRNFLY
jgi:Protein of unknown function (DUF4054)